MKRLMFILLLLLIIYATYYDLTTGTLPNAEQNPSPIQTSQSNKDYSEPIPYQEVIVESGYTVLSIVEHLHEGPVPASIQQIIYDFKLLNPGIDADQIKIGKTYNFPLYNQER